MDGKELEIPDREDRGTQYGRAAVNAVKYVIEGTIDDPREAWDKGIKDETDSHESINKGCPRAAFLGLCEEGKVKGIPSGDYTSSKKNKRYTLVGLKKLQKKPHLADNKADLWSEVMDRLGKSKKEAEQMDVLTKLWKEDLLEI